MPRPVGLDFGTTNTALAVARPGGGTELALFDSAAGPTAAFRSVLHVGLLDDGRRQVTAGPDAIRTYTAGECEGRLIQSLKTFLASRLFTATTILGRNYRLEDLVGHLLARVREAAEARFGDLGERAVVGRPVRYADSSCEEDDARALERMRRALSQAGFTDVVFEPEPLAAAWEYRRRGRGERLTLIADFGGGTTDFTLMQLRPDGRSQALGAAGLALAGDAFDARFVEHVVSEPLGAGSSFRSELGKAMPMPRWIYGQLERWHHVSFLKTPDTLGFLRRARSSSDAPERLDALLHLIEADHGFRLHGAVHACKTELSARTRSDFHLHEPPIHLSEEVGRTDLERWIEPELAAIESCWRGLLDAAGVRPAEVDAVFLTGGSAFVPAVRRPFAETFGIDRLRGGEELTTVARGLALRAAQLDS